MRFSREMHDGPGLVPAQTASVIDSLKLFAVSAASRAQAAGLHYRQEIAPECQPMLIGDATGLRQMR